MLSFLYPMTLKRKKEKKEFRRGIPPCVYKRKGGTPLSAFRRGIPPRVLRKRRKGRMPPLEWKWRCIPFWAHEEKAEDASRVVPDDGPAVFISTWIPHTTQSTEKRLLSWLEAFQSTGASRDSAPHSFLRLFTSPGATDPWGKTVGRSWHQGAAEPREELPGKPRDSS